MQALLFIIYFVIGIIQWVGNWACFREVCDWPFIVCMFVAPIVGTIPLIGAITGFIGVAYGFHWGIGGAALIYIAPYFLGILMYIAEKRERQF